MSYFSDTFESDIVYVKIVRIMPTFSIFTQKLFFSYSNITQYLKKMIKN